MDIGTKNVSAMLGPYSSTIALIADKFNVPFFLTADRQHLLTTTAEQCGTQNLLTSSLSNLLTVFPSAAQLYKVTIDLIRDQGWSTVGVLYDTMEGNNRTEIELDWFPVCLLPVPVIIWKEISEEV